MSDATHRHDRARRDLHPGHRRALWRLGTRHAAAARPGTVRLMTRVVALIAAIAAAGCFNSPTAPDAVVGRPFELKPGAVSVLPDGTRLMFREVQADSRCPMDVMCVWAGDATVAITLTPSQGSAESRELHVQPS